MNIKNLTVSYGNNTVLNNLTLTAEEGKITCILGESGCGKTTLLNAVAGLISYDGEISPVKCSYVFQNHRLIPNLTVLKNLTFVGAGEEEARAMLQRVGLADKASAYPRSLSGGEAQRVSLCRAFLYPSELLLLDEPFSSLDLKTKLSVMRLFKELKEESGRGALFVTHDLDEAVYLSDTVCVLSGGGISYTEDIENKERDFGENGVHRANLLRQFIN